MLKNNIAKGVIRDLYEALDSIVNFLGIRITTTEKLSEEQTHLRRTKSVIIGTSQGQKPTEIGDDLQDEVFEPSWRLI